jgi:hypothetical protein
MGAIYCEPCIAARLQGGIPVAPATLPVTPASESPNPALAALLGFIPGVGAMYNGQFVKAFVHLVIFVCLIALTKHVSGLFGLLIGFFVIYMVFEAQQTAKARQFGLPSPDFLGLDHLFGIHENAPPVTRAVPDTLVTPGQPLPPSIPRDSTPTGALVLVALGVVFLLHTAGIASTDRLWPLLLIGLGLWIAYKRSTGRDRRA